MHYEPYTHPTPPPLESWWQEPEPKQPKENKALEEWHEAELNRIANN
jgi:hypothetical protein